MSRGPGQIEQCIGDLFAATPDRALPADEVVAHAFALDGKPPTRAQRLSAIRAGHRVIRRTREMDEKRGRLVDEAVRRVRAALGRDTDANPDEFAEYNKLLEADRNGERPTACGRQLGGSG